MQSQTRRTLLATALCVGVLFAWTNAIKYIYPPPAPTSRPAALEPVATTGEPAVSTPSGPTTRSDDIGAAPAAPPDRSVADVDGWRVVGADQPRTVELGDSASDPANPYEFGVRLTNRGAAVESVDLSRHRDHVQRGKDDAADDPYSLFGPVAGPDEGAPFNSFVTERIRIDGNRIDLSAVPWRVEQQGMNDQEQVAFVVTVRFDEVDVLELRKTYRLTPGSPHLEIALDVTNLSDRPRIISLTEYGPVGLKQEDLRFDARRVVTAVADETGAIDIGDETPTRDDVFGSDEDDGPHRMKFRIPAGERIVWAAIANKYFAVIVTPVSPADGAVASDQLTRLVARTRRSDETRTDDLTFEMTLEPGGPIVAGGSASFGLDAFFGPKSQRVLEEASPDRNYFVVTYADRRMCTFQWIGDALRWLLTNLYAIFGNYGIAIIFLVIIVKLMLHPISKRGQIHMMRSQKKMAQLKPKLDALQKQFKNDKQRYQQEQMKLFREEGVNPAGTIFGCLPMMLQMPIWIALWTTLNTNVDMRHQPFFWWIRDLSSPDALIGGLGPYNIPLLGAMIGPIISFNLLPIIMTITMYSQQKLTQKLTKAKNPAKPAVDDQGRPILDQQAQMQKMMGFMMFFMGFIFYNFPSGLNLYILTSNLVGMLEQWQIRKHIKEKDDRGDFDRGSSPGPKPGGSGGSGKPTFIQRLQKKAEEARLTKTARPATPRKKKKRF